MNQQEAMKCRQVAQLYRALQQENQRLRDELAEKHRIDLQMAAEDLQVIALVNRRKPDSEVTAAVSVPAKPIFDYDTAEIDEVLGELVEYEETEKPRTKRKLGFYIKFVLLVIAGCIIWIAHHFGWMDFLIYFTLMVVLFLVANYYRLI